MDIFFGALSVVGALLFGAVLLYGAWRLLRTVKLAAPVLALVGLVSLCMVYYIGSEVWNLWGNPLELWTIRT